MRKDFLKIFNNKNILLLNKNEFIIIELTDEYQVKQLELENLEICSENIKILCEEISPERCPQETYTSLVVYVDKKEYLSIDMTWEYEDLEYETKYESYVSEELEEELYYIFVDFLKSTNDIKSIKILSVRSDEIIFQYNNQHYIISAYLGGIEEI